MSKNNFKFSFDQFFFTNDDFIMGININIRSGSSIERNNAGQLKAGTLIGIHILNGILGHSSEAVLRKTEKNYGW